MDVVWTDRARDKLLAVAALIAEDRPATARKLVARLLERSEVLAQFPELGRPYAPIPGMGLRILVESSYGLVYRVQGSPPQVLVLALRHQREPAPDESDLLQASADDSESERS